VSKNPPVDVALLRKAREAKDGYCFLCGCTYETPCSMSGNTCAWVAGSRFRLCTAHTTDQISEGARALRLADREKAHV
jgi:hypothetical protein